MQCALASNFWILDRKSLLVVNRPFPMGCKLFPSGPLRIESVIIISNIAKNNRKARGTEAKNSPTFGKKVVFLPILNSFYPLFPSLSINIKYQCSTFEGSLCVV